MKNSILYLGYLLLAANMLDLITTVVGISLGASEYNPLFSIGYAPFILLKILCPTLFVFVAFAASHFLNSKHLNICIGSIFSIVTIIYSYCIINNLGVIYQCLT